MTAPASLHARAVAYASTTQAGRDRQQWLSRSVSVSVRLGGVAVIVTGDDPDGCVRIRYEASGATYAEALSDADRETVRVALGKALVGRRVA